MSKKVFQILYHTKISIECVTFFKCFIQILKLWQNTQNTIILSRVCQIPCQIVVALPGRTIGSIILKIFHVALYILTACVLTFIIS